MAVDTIKRDDNRLWDSSAISHNNQKLNVFLNDLILVKRIDLITNFDLNKKTSNPTVNTLIPKINGYTPIIVVPCNSWGGMVNIWYCEITEENQISWRAYNNSDSNIIDYT